MGRGGAGLSRVRLIALRPRLGAGFELLEAREDVLAYRRGNDVVAINLSDGERAAPPHGEVMLRTHGNGPALGPHEALVARAD